MALKRSNRCVYNTPYHVVFPVKYRKALLDKGVTLASTQIAREIEWCYEVGFEKIGYDQDHIHPLAALHTKYSGSQVATTFNSITARLLFQQFSGLKKKLLGDEFWTDGYYRATMRAHGDWHSVRGYIENRGKTI